MVMTKASDRFLAIGLLIVVIVTLSSSVVVNAAPLYHLEAQWTKIWINPNDASMDLLYDINFSCDSGQVNYVEVGQPTSDFTIGQVKDSTGKTLGTQRITQSDYYAVRVLFVPALQSGSSIRFTVMTNIQGMIYLDQDNPGNVGMLFNPTWWDATVKNLRVLIVLPQGVQQNQVKTLTGVPYDNTYSDPAEGGKTVLYWERSNLLSGAKLSFGVSFPKDFIKGRIHYTGFNWFLYDFLPNYWFILLGGGLVAVFGSVTIANYLKKHPYEKPRIRMESLGARRGLMAVEASWLLGLGPQKVVVEILYSLLQKHAIWVKEQQPVLKFEAVALPEVEREQLRYYELSFLRCLGADGILEEQCLARTVMLVRDTVEEKIRGYSRQDTLNYYKKVVDEAWEQVKTAGTPELAAKAFDENLLWLISDKDFKTRAGVVLGPMYIPPMPGWWWYWWSRFPSPVPPSRAPVPSSETGTPLPGAEVADRVASSLEGAANGIVKNLEGFANAIIPSAPKTSNAPIRSGSSCACACVSCACVCACVSCACACAGGRVG